MNSPPVAPPSSEERREPVDSAAIGGRPVSAEDKRKASIEYYHLHKSKKKSPPSHAPGEKQIKTLGNAQSNPKTIAILEDAVTSGDQKKAMENGYDVGPFEKKVQSELGSLAKIQNDWDISGLDGKIPTKTELAEIFKKVNQDKTVPWEYLVDGCYARAHVTCEKILNEGVNCAKMYVIIDDPGFNEPSYPFPSWRLGAKNKFTTGEWWYHVAALTFAKDEATGEIDGYIIDPAVDKTKPIRT